jgi:hypothetical protein
VYVGWSVTGNVLTFNVLSSMEKVRTYVALGFSGIIALAFMFSLFAMFYLKLRNPQSDISTWFNISLACLGYIVGILAGLFGIAPPTQVGPGGQGG